MHHMDIGRPVLVDRSAHVQGLEAGQAGSRCGREDA